MNLARILTLTLVSLFSAAACAQTVTYNGHTYVRVTVAGLADARAQASAAGAFLAAVTDQDEHNFVAANYAGTGAYLGGSDEVTEGTWLWDSGEPFSITRWSGNEPNNAGGNEHYIALRGDGRWNDRNGNGTQALIEYASVTPVILSTQQFGPVTYHEISVANLAEARAAAHALGGYLVSIDSPGEQGFVTGALGTATPAFIGIHDDSNEGNPELDSGLPISYTNFVAAPAQSNENDYVVITTTGEWDYTNSHGATRAIVEVPPVVPDDYETNKANASIDFDGVTTDGTNPAIQTGCVGQIFTLNVSSALTLPPAEVAITLGAVQARGAAGTVELGHGQVLNLDTTDPTFGFFGGNTAPVLSPLTSYSLPVLAGVASGFQASVQLFVIDFSSASLLSLSQAAQLDIGDVATTYPGPTEDDGSQRVDVPCPITFAGVEYHQIYTNANGRITFGEGSSRHVATVASAMSGPPFVGYWTDLDPSSSPGGSITTFVDETTYTATYTDIEYIWSTVDVNFSITIHNDQSPTPGVIEIDGLTDLPPNPVTGEGPQDAVFLGLSQGGGTATDPGVTSFAPSVGGQTALATDMIYDFYGGGTGAGIASFASGIETLIFTPLPGGGYSWAGF